MADERDPQVSRRYRELGSEEPPPALDEAVLAASRRAVAPRRRWYLPLAAAAVALLAVGIALQVERERPDAEAVMDSKEQQKPQPRPSEIPPAAPQPEPRLKEEAGRDAVRREREFRFQDSAPARQAPPVPQTAPARAAADALAESPERWLERIAELRKQGRHEEADKALAEFKRRYPEYRIPDETLRRIEKE